MKIYLATSNDFKAAESMDCIRHTRFASTVELCVVKYQVQEILHHDIDVIVKSKALEAYEYLRVPCVVEHSGLFMDALPGLPGGLGQLIWNSVGDRMCGFLHGRDSREATALSVIGYCDGWRVHLFHGATRGQIASKSRGSYQYNWDPIFIPDGCRQTYGEMGMEKKRATSPAAKAWGAFLNEVLSEDGSLRLSR